MIVNVIMPSTSDSWKSIETEWYLGPASIDTKGSIFKRKFHFKQQIFHCSKNFEMAKSRESSLSWVRAIWSWKWLKLRKKVENVGFVQIWSNFQYDMRMIFGAFNNYDSKRTLSQFALELRQEDSKIFQKSQNQEFTCWIFIYCLAYFGKSACVLD